ncbi:CRISPR-associated protein Csy2 [Rhodopirellula maiorica SM1]|uniref:CRISPR-associated protein Csy2 n=1 Tax=Rhodopirellula maiorica SM1 TaxID=1265738 RepID=M5RW78_9BACT|nr:type I-F CRISPR-associated protein Csy2 [Rhodopirellula maiorica]EMI19652.1 CRISPR-associated protein Csy2 [Rhodopirellula maiorica SM1]
MGTMILIERLEVQNANAISSPLTMGVPSITAFMGFAHQLQRLVHKANPSSDLLVRQVGVVIHDIDLQTRQFPRSRSLLKLTANTRGGRNESKKSDRASFIEEGRCHLTVSLLLDCETEFLGGTSETIERMQHLVMGRMRLAGGTIINTDLPRIQTVSNDRRTLARLIPGWVLIERRDLMIEAMGEGLDAIDALHRALAIHHQRHVQLDSDANSENLGSHATVTWSSGRHQPGYIVPIATGYQALTPVVPSNNARDRDTPHRLAESVLTLGEFVLPLRLEKPSEMLWQYQRDGDLYVCQQQTCSLFEEPLS